MTALSAIYELVRPDVDLVPEPTVTRLANRVAIDFFQRSRAWGTEDEIVTIGGEARYTWPLLQIDDETVRVEKIDFVARQGQRLTWASPAQLNYRDPDWATRSGAPERVIQELDGGIRCVPKPDGEYTLAGFVRVVPTLATRELPDGVYNVFAEDLTHGVLAKLFAQKNRPWTDTDLAGFHGAQFERAVDRANQRGHHEMQYRGGTQYGGI